MHILRWTQNSGFCLVGKQYLAQILVPRKHLLLCEFQISVFVRYSCRAFSLNQTGMCLASDFNVELERVFSTGELWDRHGVDRLSL